MPRITGGGFNLRYYNLVVGAIYLACSIIGTMIMYGAEVFTGFPYWLVVVIYIATVIFSLIAAHKLRDNCYAQLLAYAAIAIPFGLFVELFIMVKLPGWTKGGDGVFRAGFICSLAIGLMTILFALLPGWLLKIKKAVILGGVAYVISLFVAIGIFNDGILALDSGSVPFSIVASLIVIYFWHLGVSADARGVITIEDAIAMPASSFLALIGMAQAIDDG